MAGAMSPSEVKSKINELECSPSKGQASSKVYKNSPKIGGGGEAPAAKGKKGKNSDY